MPGSQSSNTLHCQYQSAKKVKRLVDDGCISLRTVLGCGKLETRRIEYSITHSIHDRQQCVPFPVHSTAYMFFTSVKINKVSSSLTLFRPSFGVTKGTLSVSLPFEHTAAYLRCARRVV